MNYILLILLGFICHAVSGFVLVGNSDNTNQPDKKELTTQTEAPVLPVLNLKPSIVQFRRNNNPSLVYNITGDNILRALNTFLTSPDAKKYTDTVAKGLAAAMKAMSDDIEKKHKKKDDEEDDEDKKK